MKIARLLQGNPRKFFFIVLSFIILILLSPMIYVGLDNFFGGKDIKAFCQASLVGKSAAAIKSVAAESSLYMVASADALYFFQQGKKGGHSCDVRLNETGVVTSADKRYRF